MYIAFSNIQYTAESTVCSFNCIRHVCTCSVCHSSLGTPHGTPQLQLFKESSSKCPDAFPFNSCAAVTQVPIGSMRNSGIRGDGWSKTPIQSHTCVSMFLRPLFKQILCCYPNLSEPAQSHPTKKQWMTIMSASPSGSP